MGTTVGQLYVLGYLGLSLKDYFETKKIVNKNKNIQQKGFAGRHRSNY